MNIVDVIRSEADHDATRVAVIDGERSVTYAVLLDRVDRVSETLADLGVSAGQRVAFLCEDGLDYIVFSLGILALNVALVPIATTTHADEVDQIMDRMDVHALMFQGDLMEADSGRPLPPTAPSIQPMHLIQRTTRFPDPPGYHDLNPAFIRFSSGTTGNSKGVLLSHRSIVQRTDAANDGLRMSADDGVAWLLSMSFHFVVTILLFLRRRATIVVCSRTFPQDLLAALRCHRITFVYASPFHYQMMTRTDAFDSNLLENVRLAVSTAMKMPQANAQQFEKKFGLRLSEAYGIIEVGLPAINVPWADDFVLDAVGHPLPAYDVQIRDADTRGVGQIWVKGPGFFDAYYAPWQPRVDVLHDGFFATGDLGRRDAHGRLFLMGRDKDVINFAGMKIFPQEVETVLGQHPAIADSLVYAQPHPLYGDMPVAKVVLRHTHDSLPDADALRRFCYARLAPHMVPKKIEIVEHLERTHSGKIKRMRD